MLKWIVFPAAAIFMLVAGTIQFGPALGAAQGHGTAGYFVAETENCSKDGCNWTGNFVAPDGQVTLRNVGFIGPHGTLYRGARLAALETGDTAKVYAAHGSRDWMADLAGIVFGVIGFGLWAWCVPYRTARLWARRNGLGDWHSIASLATRCLEGSDYTAALRACAAGLYPLEAGVALLISNGTFLRREDFTRFIGTGTGISDGTSTGRDNDNTAAAWLAASGE